MTIAARPGAVRATAVPTSVSSALLAALTKARWPAGGRLIEVDETVLVSTVVPDLMAELERAGVAFAEALPTDTPPAAAHSSHLCAHTVGSCPQPTAHARAEI